jgi:hypothetical protein
MENKHAERCGISRIFQVPKSGRYFIVFNFFDLLETGADQPTKHKAYNITAVAADSNGRLEAEQTAAHSILTNLFLPLYTSIYISIYLPSLFD